MALSEILRRILCAILYYQRKWAQQCVPYGFIRESEHNSVCHIALSQKVSTIVCAMWLYQRKWTQCVPYGFIRESEHNSVWHMALSEKVRRIVCAILLYHGNWAQCMCHVALFKLSEQNIVCHVAFRKWAMSEREKSARLIKCMVFTYTNLLRERLAQLPVLSVY